MQTTLFFTSSNCNNLAECLQISGFWWKLQASTTASRHFAIYNIWKRTPLHGVCHWHIMTQVYNCSHDTEQTATHTCCPHLQQ